MIVRQQTTHISEELLDKLLVALTQDRFDRDSSQYDIGYFRAQEDFKFILEHHANKPLVKSEELGIGTVTPPPASGRRWWKL